MHTPTFVGAMTEFLAVPEEQVKRMVLEVVAEAPVLQRVEVEVCRLYPTFLQKKFNFNGDFLMF